MTTQDSDTGASFVGRETVLGVGPDRVSDTLIRYWCEAFEDSNSRYWDGLVDESSPALAPAPLAASLCRLPYWPVDPDIDQRGLIGELGDAINCPESVVRSVSWDFHRELRVGDQVGCTERVTAVSDRKQTRLGPGHFVTLEREYTDADGERISTATLGFFKYARTADRDRAPRRAVTSGAPPVRSARDRTGLTSPVVVDLTEIRPGVGLPTMHWTLHGTRMVQMAYISRDFNPVHHDPDYARANGLENMIVQWACYAGLLFKYLGHNFGPEIGIDNLSFTMNRPLYAGRNLAIDAVIAAVEPRDAGSSAELELTVSDGDGATAQATARLRP